LEYGISKESHDRSGVIWNHDPVYNNKINIRAAAIKNHNDIAIYFWESFIIFLTRPRGDETKGGTIDCISSSVKATNSIKFSTKCRAMAIASSPGHPPKQPGDEAKQWPIS